MRAVWTKRGEHRTRRRLWFAVAAAMVTGLIGGCGASGPPDPLSAPLVEGRSWQVQLMAGALDEVAAAIGGQVLGESSVDECYEGQRNWKVDTGYRHRCSLLMGVLIGIEGDFRTRMLETDLALRDLGWQSPDGEWPGRLVDDYWDLRAGESRDGRVRLDRLPGPLTVLRDDLRLLFDYGSVADDRGLERIDRSQQRTSWCCGPPFYTKRELMDMPQEGDAHLILITVEGQYFQQ